MSVSMELDRTTIFSYPNRKANLNTAAIGILIFNYEERNYWYTDPKQKLRFWRDWSVPEYNCTVYKVFENSKNRNSIILFVS